MASAPSTTARATSLLLPVEVRLDGADVGAETRLTDTGLGLVLETAIPHPDAPVHVESHYLAAPGAVITQVTHAVLGAGPADTKHRAVSAAELPVLAARRRCLEDHLQRVVDAVTSIGHRVAIDFDALAAALAAADRS